MVIDTFRGFVWYLCAPSVVFLGICGVGTLVSDTIRVTRNLSSVFHFR
jgi:hypothetical protein